MEPVAFRRIEIMSPIGSLTRPATADARHEAQTAPKVVARGVDVNFFELSGAAAQCATHCVKAINDAEL